MDLIIAFYLILGNWQEDETCCVLMIGSVASQNPTLAQARLLFCLEVLTAMMRTRDSVVTCSGNTYVENDMKDA